PRAAARRAPVEPGPVAAREDAARAQAGDPPRRHHDALRDARAGGGVRAGRPHRGTPRGPPRAGRRAGGAVRAALHALRRAVHRTVERPSGDVGGRPRRADRVGPRLAGDRRAVRLGRRRRGPGRPPRVADVRHAARPGSARGRRDGTALRGTRGLLRRRDGAGRGRGARAPVREPRGRQRAGRARVGRTSPARVPEGGMSRRRLRIVALLVGVLLFWIVGYPLVLTLAEALGAPHWTLDHVREFVRRPAEWQALWASLWISVATVALS